MTKDVIVSISGLQMPAEGEAEPVEVITVGIITRKTENIMCCMKK